MKNVMLPAFFILILCSQAQAYTQQVIIGGAPGTALTTNQTTYYSISSGGGASGAAAPTATYATFAASGKITNLLVHVSGSPGSSSSNGYNFYLYNQSGATLLTTTLNNNTTSNSDLVHSYTVTTGDTLCIQVTVNGSPNAVNATWSMVFTPNTAGQTVLYGGIASLLSSWTNGSFTGMLGNLSATGVGATGEARSEIIIPCAGKIENLYANISAAPGTGNSVTLTVDHNGANTSPAMTITFGATDTAKNDTASGHYFNVSAGDTIDMETTVTGSPNGAQYNYGVVFVPNTPGQFMIGNQDADVSLASGGTQYWMTINRALNNATEPIVQEVSNPFLVENIYAFVATAAGGGQSYTFTLRDNTANAGSVSVALNNTVGPLSTSAYYQVQSGDLIDFKAVGSAGAGTQTTASVSILGYIPPHGSEFFQFLKGK